MDTEDFGFEFPALFWKIGLVSSFNICTNCSQHVKSSVVWTLTGGLTSHVPPLREFSEETGKGPGERGWGIGVPARDPRFFSYLNYPGLAVWPFCELRVVPHALSTERHVRETLGYRVMEGVEEGQVLARWYFCKNQYCASVLWSTQRLFFFFLRAVLGTEQNWGEGAEKSHIFLAPTDTQPSPRPISATRVGRFLPLVNLHGHVTVTQSPQCPVRLTLVLGTGFGQACDVMYSPYSVTQSSLTVLKLLCAPPVHSSPIQPLAGTDFCMTSVVLSFPESDHM